MCATLVSMPGTLPGFAGSPVVTDAPFRYSLREDNTIGRFVRFRGYCPECPVAGSAPILIMNGAAWPVRRSETWVRVGGTEAGPDRLARRVEHAPAPVAGQRLDDMQAAARLSGRVRVGQYRWAGTGIGDDTEHHAGRPAQDQLDRGRRGVGVALEAMPQRVRD